MKNHEAIEKCKDLCKDWLKKEESKEIFAELRNKKLGLMPVQCGSKYEEGGLMVVGRAANGWTVVFDDDNISVDDYVDKVYEEASGEIDYYWKGRPNERCEYNYNRSPLWQLIHRYLEVKHGKELVKEWSSTILNTNLYMIAPNIGDRGANPKGKLQEKTRTFMNKLLEEAVKEFKPGEILFITGKDLLVDFGSDLVDRIESVGNEEGFVVGKGKLKTYGTKFIVVNRPEGRKGKRVDQAEEIKEVSQNLK